MNKKAIYNVIKKFFEDMLNDNSPRDALMFYFKLNKELDDIFHEKIAKKDDTIIYSILGYIDGLMKVEENNNDASVMAETLENMECPRCGDFGGIIVTIVNGETFFKCKKCNAVLDIVLKNAS